MRVLNRDQGQKEGKRPRDQDDGGSFKCREFPRGPRYTRYTPLNVPRTTIMKEAMRVDLLTFVRKYIISRDY